MNKDSFKIDVRQHLPWCGKNSTERGFHDPVSYAELTLAAASQCWNSYELHAVHCFTCSAINSCKPRFAIHAPGKEPLEQLRGKNVSRETGVIGFVLHMISDWYMEEFGWYDRDVSMRLAKMCFAAFLIDCTSFPMQLDSMSMHVAQVNFLEDYQKTKHDLFRHVEHLGRVCTPEEFYQSQGFSRPLEVTSQHVLTTIRRHS